VGCDKLLLVVLELAKMVHGGLCLAKLPDGRVALVRGGLPGEVVEAELAIKAGVLQGRVWEVLEPHPARIPASEHPGLDYSFVRYETQLALKREVVTDALQRSLKREVEVPALVPAPSRWAYRSAVQPAATRNGLGYRAMGSHDVTVLANDPVASEAIQRLWPRLAAQRLKGVREVAFRANDDGEVLACLIASASARNYLELAHALLREGLSGVSYAPFDARGRFRSGFTRLAGERSIRQRYGDYAISVTATSFAQPNPAAATRLYQELSIWAGEGRRALDLYAGSGIIGMHLATRYQEVVAFDIDRSSIVRGQRDAERLGLDNLSFVKADAKRLGALPEADLIAVDPPRAGLAKPLREAIVASSARRLIYVSCDVATWARDVAHFVASGFALERFQPYDFYPHTHHIEMLSLLVRG
jgi:23S rRNA (uracil1939-C5)-methyltransferase